MKKVIVIGSGWAGSAFVKHIDTEKYDVTVVSYNKNFLYTPLLANSIFYKKNLTCDIRDINNIKYSYGCVNNVNFKNNNILVEGENIKYDYLVLAHGSETNTFNIEGVKENCLFLKSEADIKIIKEKLLSLPEMSNIAVIGCGLTGSEIIGNLIDMNKYNIYAIDGLKMPLTSFGKSISNYTHDLWSKKGVNSFFGNFVTRVDNKKISFKDKSIDYDLAFWCGGVKISELSKNINCKLGLDCKFGIPVNKNLQVGNTDNVFAIGDCAYNKNLPTAQVAYQEGKYLANNFNSKFKGTIPFSFSSKGQICYIGNGESVYKNDFFSANGKYVGYFNKFIHIYNSINYDQMIQFVKDML